MSPWTIVIHYSSALSAHLWSFRPRPLSDHRWSYCCPLSWYASIIKTKKEFFKVQIRSRSRSRGWQRKIPWPSLTGPRTRLDPKKSNFRDSCPDTFGRFVSGFTLAYQLLKKFVRTPDLAFPNPKNFQTPKFCLLELPIHDWSMLLQRTEVF